METSERLDLVMDVKVGLSVKLGSCQLPMKSLIDLQSGSVIRLDQAADAPVCLYVNEKLIAYGDVVVIEDNFGIKITELVGDSAEKEAEAAQA